MSIWSFSGPYFPAFGLNRERYGVSGLVVKLTSYLIHFLIFNIFLIILLNISFLTFFRYLFWSIRNNNGYGRIERSFLDGSGRQTVLKKGIIYPNDLSIDYMNKRILFIDVRARVIESANFDGSARIKVFHLVTTGIHLSMTYSPSIQAAYVSEWYTDGIYILKNHSSSKLLHDNHFLRGKLGQIRLHERVVGIG